MIFDGHDDAPRSIILTTLAATYYSGTTSVVATIGEFAAAVDRAIRERAPAPIEVVNPTNDGENFTDGKRESATRSPHLFGSFRLICAS